MNTNYNELLERYFDDLLSPRERAEVEQLKVTDEAFRAEFELFEKTQKALQLSALLELKEEVRSIHQSSLPRKTAKVISWTWMSIAASIVALLSMGWYAQQYSNENLYQNAYSPVGDYITNMDDSQSELEKALELMDRQEYALASQSFRKIYESSGDEVALFYEGHSLFLLGDDEGAIKTWEGISGVYQAEAQWYIALAYLRQDQEQQASLTLLKIVESNADQKYVIQAKQLLEKMSSPFRKIAL